MTTGIESKDKKGRTKISLKIIYYVKYYELSLTNLRKGVRVINHNLK